MADALKLIASLEWIALGIVVFVKLKSWNKKLSEAHKELIKTIKEN